MIRHRTMIRLYAVLAAVASVKGCGDGDGPTEPPEAPRPMTLTVIPLTAELNALGATVQLAADVRDQNGGVVAGATVTWQSSTPAVATVDGSGLVTAAGNGEATVTARAGGASGTAVVTVMQSPDSVAVSPAEAAISALGGTLQLAADAFDANGHAVAGANFEWESSDAAIATVDASGLVTGVANGTATITARAGEAEGLAEVNVGPNQQLEALAALYHATGGPNWVNSDNWLTDAPLRDWHGVVTDNSDRVVRLEFRMNNLSGPLPAELGSLTSLTALVLRGNNLDGPIPPELGNLASLTTLHLVANKLIGPIPPELGNLTSLTELDLYLNNLRGPIPPELGKLTNLEILDLPTNQLSGPIPPELGNLTNLTRLTLSLNNLSGPIPPELDTHRPV